MLTLSGLGLPNPNLLAAGLGPAEITSTAASGVPSSVLVAQMNANATQATQAAQDQAAQSGGLIPPGSIPAVPVPTTFVCPDGSVTTDPTLAACPTTIAGIDLSTLFWIGLVVVGGWWLWKKYQTGPESGVPELVSAQ